MGLWDLLYSQTSHVFHPSHLPQWLPTACSQAGMWDLNAECKWKAIPFFYKRPPVRTLYWPFLPHATIAVSSKYFCMRQDTEIYEKLDEWMNRKRMRTYHWGALILIRNVCNTKFPSLTDRGSPVRYSYSRWRELTPFQFCQIPPQTKEEVKNNLHASVPLICKLQGVQCVPHLRSKNPQN